VFTGIHTDPRQLEFPPNIPVLDSAGSAATLAALVAPISPWGHEETYVARVGYGDLFSRVGLEPEGHTDKSQVIDFNNRQKRSNRSFRRFEVHGGYMAYEFLSRKPRIIVWKARRIRR
jgi:hypothetical protein